MTAATCPSWCDPALCELTDAGTPDAAHGHRVKLDELVEVVQWSPVDGTPAAPPVVSLLPSVGDLTAQDAREVAAALVRAAELVECVPAPVERAYAAGHLAGCDCAHQVDDVLPRMRDLVDRWKVVHELAHALDDRDGHGSGFRDRLVELVRVAFGDGVAFDLGQAFGVGR